MAIGPWQIIIIALILVLLFGASRFASLGKGLADGIRNFKKGISEETKDTTNAGDATGKAK